LGVQQAYTCAGKTSGYIPKGKDQEWLVTDYAEGYLQVQLNNLLSPSQPADSLIVSIISTEYYDPILGHSQAAASLFGTYEFYDINNPPNHPAIIMANPIKTVAGIKIATIRKRKLGNVSTTVDTFKIYPGQTKLYQINW
jgi:hypothetical protein